MIIPFFYDKYYEIKGKKCYFWNLVMGGLTIPEYKLK